MVMMMMTMMVIGDDADDDDDDVTVHVCVSFSIVSQKTFCLSQVPPASDTPLHHYLSINLYLICL